MRSGLVCDCVRCIYYPDDAVQSKFFLSNDSLALIENGQLVHRVVVLRWRILSLLGGGRCLSHVYVTVHL